MKLYFAGSNLGKTVIHNLDEVVHRFTILVYPESIEIELQYTYAVLLRNDRCNLDVSHIKQIRLPEGFKVQQISCTDTKFVVLTDCGGLYKCDTVLGKGDLSRLPNLLSSDDIESGDSIIKIACGCAINVAISKFGKIFDSVNKLDFELPKVVDVKVGNEHCLLLDEDGRIYSYGRGSRGQLGHSSLEDEPEPRLIQALDGIKFVQIATGGWHSCALSKDGDLYAWGWNSNGQLGIYEADISVLAAPQAITFGVLDVNVVKVACGMRHTVAILDGGKLYGAGWNKYRQLGIESSDEDVKRMTFLFDLEDSVISTLKCGPWSTAVVLSIV